MDNRESLVLLSDTMCFWILFLLACGSITDALRERDREKEREREIEEEVKELRAKQLPSPPEPDPRIPTTLAELDALSAKQHPPEPKPPITAARMRAIKEFEARYWRLIEEAQADSAIRNARRVVQDY
jgi:hypothetical protein